MPLKGSYCLSIIIDSRIKAQIGSLGSVTFEPGEYIYVGSAMNGIEPRVRRHLNTSEKRFRAIHWHIDYLLKEQGVHVKAAHAYISDERLECKIAKSLSVKFSAFRGFGSSDCRCKGHLFKIQGNWNPLELSYLAKQLIPLDYP